MSEQNILNPAQTSLFNPDWGYTEGLPEMRSSFQAQSGKVYTRRQFGLGRVYDLFWNNRDLATKHALQQWAQQYENDFFSLADWERGRYFSGRFDGPLTFSPAGNQRYNIRGRFVELPGVAMFQIPSNFTRDAIFLEERDGFGADLVKLKTPANWSLFVAGSQHGGQAYVTNTTDETAEWVYFGYGCQTWSEKGPDEGKVELTQTRIRDGVIVEGPVIFDLYSASPVNSAVIDSQGLPLDFYRLKLRCTGTKNVAATDTKVFADAIQVMQ